MMSVRGNRRNAERPGLAAAALTKRGPSRKVEAGLTPTQEQPMAADDRPADGPPPPVVPAETDMHELTWAPLVMGSILGIVFGASSLYLVLKVGLTVSASIPVAVLSITLFRLLPLRRATILE